MKMNKYEPITFEDGQEFQNLPVGSHEPCLLLPLERHEPTEKNLKSWPDLKPSWRFSFVLYDPGSEHHKMSSVRFCNVSKSKLSNLYQFVTNLLGGTPPTTFDPASFESKWFQIQVRQKEKSDKLFVQSADPIDAPADERKFETELLADDAKDDLSF